MRTSQLLSILFLITISFFVENATASEKKNQDIVNFPQAVAIGTLVFHNDRPLETQSNNTVNRTYPRQKMNAFPLVGTGGTGTGADDSGSVVPEYRYTYCEQKLIQVKPGALEAPAQGYTLYFPFDERLNRDYKNGSFAFNGTARQLVWRNQAGWGIFDNSGNFMPYLLRSDLENINTPSVSFFWWNNNLQNIPGGGILLDYRFTIPLYSTTQSVAQLRDSTQSFDRGFAYDAPPIKNGAVYLWDSFTGISVYNRASPFADIPEKYANLPKKIQALAFSIENGKNMALFARNGNIVDAYGFDGSKRWSVPGAPPLISDGEYAYCIRDDYAALRVIDLDSGLFRDILKLERNLPRQENAFAFATLNGRPVLLFTIPQQGKTFCFELKP